VREVVGLITRDKKQALEQIEDNDQKLKREKEFDIIENNFINLVISTDKELLDAEYYREKFSMFVEHNKDGELLEYLKHGKYPKNAAEICEQNQLYVEQAYILLDCSDENKN
jgi:hypothetical protein